MVFEHKCLVGSDLVSVRAVSLLFYPALRTSQSLLLTLQSHWQKLTGQLVNWLLHSQSLDLGTHSAWAQSQPLNREEAGRSDGVRDQGEEGAKRKKGKAMRILSSIKVYHAFFTQVLGGRL